MANLHYWRMWIDQPGAWREITEVEFKDDLAELPDLYGTIKKLVESESSGVFMCIKHDNAYYRVDPLGNTIPSA
jgi:hypothetical protein